MPILGENGAGKSTLIKIMAGVVAPDEGRMTLDGQPVTFASPAAANAAGIVCIFQELSLIPDLSVADNIVISNPPTALRHDRPPGPARASPRRRWPSRRRRTSTPLRSSRTCRCRAARWWRSPRRWRGSPRILILDEATSALTAADVAQVFSASSSGCANEGLALLYISHRMHEIAELADDCTVFRNGRKIATYAAGTKTDNEVVELMIGREYKNVFPPKARRTPCSVRPSCLPRPLLDRTAQRHFASRFTPAKSSGLGGLDGQGQRELLLALFGVLRGVSGEHRDRRQARRTINGPAEAKSSKASAWR